MRYACIPAHAVASASASSCYLSRLAHRHPTSTKPLGFSSQQPLPLNYANRHLHAPHSNVAVQPHTRVPLKELYARVALVLLLQVHFAEQLLAVQNAASKKNVAVLLEALVGALCCSWCVLTMRTAAVELPLMLMLVALAAVSTCSAAYLTAVPGMQSREGSLSFAGLRRKGDSADSCVDAVAAPQQQRRRQHHRDSSQRRPYTGRSLAATLSGGGSGGIDSSKSSSSSSSSTDNAAEAAAAAAASPRTRRPGLPVHTGEGGRGTGGAADCYTRYVSECVLPTARGTFRLRAYSYEGPDKSLEPMAIMSGDISSGRDVPLRVHDQVYISYIKNSTRINSRVRYLASLRSSYDG
jgi:hypothetical protein